MSRIYLVTGAAGFLGSNICAQLLEKGEKVRALVLPNDKSVRNDKCHHSLCKYGNGRPGLQRKINGGKRNRYKKYYYKMSGTSGM